MGSDLYNVGRNAQKNRKNYMANVIIRANVTKIRVILMSVLTSICFLSVRW